VAVCEGGVAQEGRTGKVSSLHKVKIKQLRADARRLVVIAKHLRDEAHSLAMEERAERARVNFYSKPSSVDPGVVMTPDISDEKKELVF